MNVIEYIKNNEILSNLPFLIVYTTILELIDDGFILEKLD